MTDKDEIHNIIHDGICEYCMHTENSHSFYLEDNVTNTYKTIIKDAKIYYNSISIIYHIKKILYHNKVIKDNKHWIWIIDFSDASIKHYLSLNTVIDISKWLNTNPEAKNIKEIKIINSGYLIYPLIKLAQFYLPKYIKITC